METKKRTGGFTLIELIVVIAILGILAGVGTVAYTGYIKAANKSVDQQLVGDIAYAIQLADYAHPGMLDDGGMVVLTDNASPAVSASDSVAFYNAIKNAIPNLDSARLKFDWEMDISTMNGIINSMGEDTGLSNALGAKTEDGKTATVSYAENANQMWDAVSELAGTMNEQFPDKEAGEYVAMIAGATNGKFDADTMANNWNVNTSIGMDVFFADTDEESFYAGAGAMLARNFAFVEYLKNNTDVDLSENDIKALQSYKNEDGTPDPITATTLMQEIIMVGESYDEEMELGEFEESELREYLNTDFQSRHPGVTVDVVALSKALNDYTTQKVYTADGREYTQAEVDGIAYYTLMKNVTDISTGEDPTYDPKSDSYFNDLSGYVTMAGQICSGKMDVAALGEALSSSAGAGTAVVILAQKSNNVLTIYTTPLGAWAGATNK